MSVPHPSAVDLYRASFSDELYEENNAEKEASYAFLAKRERDKPARSQPDARLLALQALLNPR